MECSANAAARADPAIEAGCANPLWAMRDETDRPVWFAAFALAPMSRDVGEPERAIVIIRVWDSREQRIAGHDNAAAGAVFPPPLALGAALRE